MFASPGGNLDPGESLEEACVREVREESGLIIKPKLRLLTVANIFWQHGKQYLDFGFLAEWESGEPEVREPNKCERWDCYSADRLPEPLLPTDHLKLKALAQGEPYPKYLGTLKF